MQDSQIRDLFCTIQGGEGGMWLEVWHYENETVRFVTLHARLDGNPVSYSSCGFATAQQAEQWARDKAKEYFGVE